MQESILNEQISKQFLIHLGLITKFIPSLLTILITIILARYINKLIVKVISKVNQPGEESKISHLLKHMAKAVIWAIATLNILTVLGVDIMPLLASLGLTGFALGLACKDMLENIIAGIMLLLYSPFKLGDKIVFSGNSGIVTRINYRFTELKKEDNSIILIPNSMLLKNVITVTE